MCKHLFLILASLVMTTLALAVETNATYTLSEALKTKHTLRFKKGKPFRILILSDVQSQGPHVPAPFLENIEKLVSTAEPDLVLFCGDNSVRMKEAEMLKSYLTDMAGPAEKRKIPWAHVYGNHDDEREGVLSKIAQQEIYESFPYCVSKRGDPSIYGVGNYLLPIYASETNAILFAVWGLDSGTYNKLPNNVGYDFIHRDQIDWYEKTSKELEENQKRLVPGMMFFHIPLQEFYIYWTCRQQFPHEGEMRQNFACPTVGCDLGMKIFQRGDIKLIANGHAHNNYGLVEFNGVKFCFVSTPGNECFYNEDILGGRLVEISEDNPFEVKTRMLFINTPIPKNHEHR